MTLPASPRIASRFRGFLPVVVDVETGGVNPATDALLEIAIVLLGYDDQGCLAPVATHAHHVQPFAGAVLNPEALAFNGIDPYHPFRAAIAESEALHTLLRLVRQAVRESGCNRAVLVGHNPILDLGFINAAVQRNAIKRNPFHPFSSFDTASLAGLAYGQTVLARAVQCAGLQWDQNQAHSAIYDAERTAELFCAIVNLWDKNVGIRVQPAQTPAQTEAET
jgi:ribonuclease T